MEQNTREYRNLITSLTVFFGSMPKRTVFLIGLLLVVSIGSLRYLTGPELAFSLFYLFPICLVTWFAGRNFGIATSLAGALSWLFADVLMQDSFSHFLIPFINETLRLIVFLFIT